MPKPDAHVETPAGKASLWWRATPSHQNERVGLIGEHAGDALEAACARLREEGCTFAIGPMDGSTWRRYRLVTDFGTEPPFLLEPWNTPEELARWVRAGFEPIARYTSAAGPLGAVDPRTDAAEAKLRSEGYALRRVRVDAWEDELRAIYPLLTASFAQNFLYTPLAIEEYLEIYRPLAALVRPETNLVAEHRGTIVGLFFTYPASADSLVFKTLAVHPEHEGKGLGGVLAARTLEAAVGAGFRRGIHALMEESNRSQRISRHYGETIRRYALLGKRL